MKTQIVSQLIATQIHSQVVDWTKRITANGGSLPSYKTVSAINRFYNKLVSRNLVASFKSMCCFVPDNLIAALTPLIKIYGNDPWTNYNFVLSDLSVDGLKGNGTDKKLDTGINPNLCFSTVNTGGLTLYSTYSDNSTKSDFGVAGASFSNFHLLCGYYGTSAYFDCYTGGGGGRVSGPSLTNSLGFTSGNRTASNAISMYIANSTVSFTETAVGTGSPGSVRPNYNLPLFCWNNNGTYSQYTAKRFSFAAVHEGFSSSDDQYLYNAIQSLRQEIGGGWV